MPENEKAAIGRLGKQIGKLGNIFTNLVAIVDPLQSLAEEAVVLNTASIRINTSLSQNLKTVETTFKDTPLGIAAALEGQVNAMQVGLKGNTEQTSKLFTQMKFTGQNAGAMLGSMRELQIVTGISNTSRENLVKRTMVLSETFHISTGNLIKALGAVKEQLATVGAIADAAGRTGSAAYAESVETLAGLVGPGFEKHLGAAMKIFTDGTGEGLSRAVLLGVEGFRDLETTMNMDLATLTNMIGISAESIRNLVGPMTETGDAFVGLRIGEGVFSSRGIVSIQALQRALESVDMEAALAAEQFGVATDKFTNTLGAVWARFVEPFQRFFVANIDNFTNLVTNLGRILIPIMTGIMDIVSVISNFVLGIFGGAFGGIADFLFGIDKSTKDTADSTKVLADKVLEEKLEKNQITESTIALTSLIEHLTLGAGTAADPASDERVDIKNEVARMRHDLRMTVKARLNTAGLSTP